MSKFVVICVDDELTILDSLEIQLRRYLGAEYIVETVVDGEEALELIEELIAEQSEVPLVIADCIMPDIRGDELLKRIHVISPKTIKIMLTGQADLEAVGNAINSANLYRYITKPWQNEDLKLAVQEAVSSYFQEKKLAEKNTKLAEYSQNLEQLVKSRTQELEEKNLQLLASEKKYRDLVETSQDMIWSVDREGRYTFVNQAVKQIYGYDPEEMLGRRFADFMTPEQYSQDQEVFQGIFNGEQLFQYETTHLAKDRRPIHLLFNAIALLDDQKNVIGTTGTASDITKRKQAEQALLASEKKYRALVEASQDMIWSVDAEERYTFVNQAVKQIYGYDPEEMLGRRFADFEPPEQRTNDLELFQRLLKGESVVQYETTQLAKDGRPLYLMFNAIALFDDQGNVIGTMGTASDITKRKLAEDALKQTAYAADAANRAKSEFLSRMSHELRTPLNAILGFTQVMNRNPSLSPEAQEHLGIISRSGEHLLELINDILEMSKIESGRITVNETSFDLYYLLDTLKEMFQLKAKFKGIQLIFDRVPEIPQYVKTDESKLRQVLINLLSNAIKFTEAGKVALRVRVGDGEIGRLGNQENLDNGKNSSNTLTPIRHHPNSASPQPLIPSSPHLGFEVEDTGPGIAPEEMHLLFVPFEQTETGRKSQQGTGLGLPLTRQFVQLMGGNITVSSIVGKGTILKFNVPLCLAQSHEVETPQETRRVIGLAPDQPKYRILVVDDVKSSSLLLVKILASTGFEVREATNGLEAIALWESWEPHLILMDMLMPVMDGYEATRQIKAREMGRCGDKGAIFTGISVENSPFSSLSPVSNPQSKTIIIALTANAFEEDKAVILSSGCDELVIKPFQEETIFETIGRYLGVRYLYEEPAVMTLEVRPQHEESPTDPQLKVYLSQMTAEWVTQLYQEAVTGSDCQIFQLIEQIPSNHAPLRQVLMDWVNNFRFDRVLNLIEQAKRD